MQLFLKLQHPWIHLCALSFSSSNAFSSETARCCSRSRRGIPRAANLSRKTTKESGLLCCQPQSYVSHSLGLWKNLATGLFWKENSRIWKLTWKTRSFWSLNHVGGRITLLGRTGDGHYEWRSLGDSPPDDFQSSKCPTSCVGMLQLDLFYLFYYKQ